MLGLVRSCGWTVLSVPSRLPPPRVGCIDLVVDPGHQVEWTTRAPPYGAWRADFFCTSCCTTIITAPMCGFGGFLRGPSGPVPFEDELRPTLEDKLASFVYRLATSASYAECGRQFAMATSYVPVVHHQLAEAIMDV
jgi:hypothetical protein